MAEEIIESPFSNNFGIENTLETGLGNAQLLHDLLGEETATGNPDDLEKIEKEIPGDKPLERKPAKAREIPGDEEDKNKDTDKLASGQSLVSDFLNAGEDNEEEEEEEEQEGKLADKPVSDTPEEGEPESSQFTALANDLFRLGVFTKTDEDADAVISTPEQFLERFNLEKKNGAEQILDNFIGQFGQDYQDAFQAIYVKGVDPKDYWGTYNNIVSFAELDLTQEENQVAVTKQALLDQGWELNDAIDEIKRLQGYGDLESIAQKHHKVLVKKEATKLQQMEREAERELQQRNAIKGQWIQNVQTTLQEKLKTKEFDGIPINPKLANELQDFLLMDKYKTANGELLTDFDKAILELKRPENHAMKVKLALLMKILEKDPTLSTIQRSGVTKKSEQLFDELARQKTKNKSSAPAQGRPNSWFT